MEVNLANDGSPSGTWQGRAQITQPLASGPNGVIGVDVSDLEGRHRIRVVIDGASNSPLTLGTLQLDRTAPVASSISLTPEGGVVVADWIQSDALSGTDPAAPVVVEVNASPAGDAAGVWVPFAEQPAPGDGRKTARTSLASLPDGRHLVRARTRDRAGNVAIPTLGTVTSDATPPVVTQVRVVRAPGAVDPVAELALAAGDGGGTGLAGGPTAGPAGRPDIDWTTPGAPTADRVLVRLPGPGVHLVTVRAVDRVGNRGESAPIAIRVPTVAEAADARVGRPPDVSASGGRPSADVLWAYAAVRRFHARRGVPLRARLRVAPTDRAWRALLGTAAAGRYRGYATLRGDVLLGPAATRGLTTLSRARRGTAPAPSRADLDRATTGLAVLLHETIHATGPAARKDVTGTRSGAALEEGLAEAVTVDGLGAYARSLRLAPPLERRLRAAVRRYRPAYGAQVAWVRSLSARATGAAAGSARARDWRRRVADTWGADRWTRLAAATGTDEATLRAQATARAGAQEAAEGT